MHTESTPPLSEVIYRNKYNNTNIKYEFYVVPEVIIVCVLCINYCFIFIFYFFRRFAWYPKDFGRIIYTVSQPPSLSLCFLLGTLFGSCAYTFLLIKYSTMW